MYFSEINITCKIMNDKKSKSVRNQENQKPNKNYHKRDDIKQIKNKIGYIKMFYVTKIRKVTVDCPSRIHLYCNTGFEQLLIFEF